MPRFAANLTTLFTEVPLLDRIGAAAEAGFAGVEVQAPYEVPAQEFRDRLVIAGMPLVLFNGPPPNYTGGEPGWAAGPSARFESDFRRVLRYAGVLKPRFLHLMSGPGDGPQARAAMVANLRHACAAAPNQALTIEPINRDDMPGYFLSDYDLALGILDEVDAPNLFLQFDAYHAQRITGDMAATWEKVRHRVGHVQVAGVPGRHEPMDGEIDYPAFFARLDAEGYTGWVSAEYHPAGLTGPGLSWLPTSS
jgi:hydroxypyruvate isomerase